MIWFVVYVAILASLLVIYIHYHHLPANLQCQLQSVNGPFLICYTSQCDLYPVLSQIKFLNMLGIMTFRQLNGLLLIIIINGQQIFVPGAWLVISPPVTNLINVAKLIQHVVQLVHSANIMVITAMHSLKTWYIPP